MSKLHSFFIEKIRISNDTLKLPHFFTVILIATLATSCMNQHEEGAAPTLSDKKITEGTDNEIEDEITSDEFRHPLANQLINGKVPLQEIKDFPDGSRIAIGSIQFGDGEKTMGIRKLEQHPISQEEMAIARAEKASGAEAQGGMVASYETVDPKLGLPEIDGKKLSSRIAADVLDWLRNASNSSTIVLQLRVPRPSSYVPITLKMESAIAKGLVQNEADRFKEKRKAQEAQRVVVSEATTPAVQFIENIGGKIDYICRNIFCLRATVNAVQLRELLSSALITRIDTVHEIKENATGQEILDGTQAFQYLDDGVLSYNGDPNGVPIKIGVLEHTGLFFHQGFNDWSTSSRIKEVKRCSHEWEFLGFWVYLEKCRSGNSPVGNGHGTHVASLVLGDLMDGQDSAITTVADRRARSGYGREAELFFWSAAHPNGDSHIDVALDDIAGSDIQILNMSIEIGGADATCTGQTALSQDINDLYDGGILTFYAAGNDGNSSTTNCRIDEPGSAMGAFVVGSHRNIVNEPIWNYSSRGGTSTEGRGRSILDMVLPGRRTLVPDHTGGYTTCNGTSCSAPIMTGLAADYIEWYVEENSSYINNPGHLHSNLLLLGDREESNSPKEYSNLFGAGRLKMRLFEQEGMDSPYEAGRFGTCVDHGKSVTQPLNNGYKISSLVEPIKAVGFFYDRTHETGQWDDVDMYLERSTNNVNWSVVDSDIDSYDEKMRVFEDDVTSSSYYWRLRLKGYRVTSDNTGCGANSIRVYYAWFFEDSARNDANGPGTEVAVE